jgi:hypothetical protein
MLCGHSPFWTEGCPWRENCSGVGVPTNVCPETRGTTHIPAAKTMSAEMDRNNARNMFFTPFQGSGERLVRIRPVVFFLHGGELGFPFWSPA